MTSSKLPYELRLGVTGHLDIKDADGVARAVSRLLDYIESTLRRRMTPLSWVVVSSLARGADRIVARKVLERGDARLEVVTPFDVDEYRTDFHETPTDLSEFEELWKKSSKQRELHGQPAPKTARDDSYLRAGEHVVEVCEIMIAVWDGKPPNGRGGTADVVRYALQRERVVLWIDKENPGAPPRVLQSVEGSEELTVTSAELPRSTHLLSRGFEQQAAYCVDPTLRADEFGANDSYARQVLARVAKRAGLPFGDVEPALSPMLRELARADVLALHYQKWHLFVVTAGPCLAAGAVTVAVAQVLFFHEHPRLIVIEVAAMLAVLGLWAWSRGRALHEKWLQNRHVAERLRTTIYLTLAGAGAAVRSERHDPLPFYRGPSQWIALVSDALSRAALKALPPLDFEARRQFLLTAWIRDQKKFHESTARKKEGSAKCLHSLGVSLFALTLIMAVLHFSDQLHQPWENLVTFLALILPAWGGMIHAIASQLELERIAQRSGRMERNLGRIEHHLGHAKTMKELRHDAEEAAVLMSTENYEWWVLLSFQEAKLQV
jgi:hypothetical protein